MTVIKITVEEFLNQVRYQINDTDKVEYSDAELISYINEGLRFISNELIRLSSSLLLKKVNLELTNGEVSLPNDFVKEEAVLNSQGYVLKSYPYAKSIDQYGYKIIGNKLYSDNTEITLFYYAPYSFVSTLNDEISIPDYLLNLLKEIVVFLALNRNEYILTVEQRLFKIFVAQIYEIACSINNSFYERELPFKI